MVIIHIFLVVGIHLTDCLTVSTVVGSTVILQCNSTDTYPSWSGPAPDGTLRLYNYHGSQELNPALGGKNSRISWYDFRNLMISNISHADEGSYNCVSKGGHQTVSLVVRGNVTISVTSIPVNCGDEAVLTCHTTESLNGSRTWRSRYADIMINGQLVQSSDAGKYSEKVGVSSFSLTIHNFSLSDNTEYRCTVGFIDSEMTHIQFECKASSAEFIVFNSKKLSVTVDNLYPRNPSFSVSIKSVNSALLEPGSTHCGTSSKVSGHARCVWTSGTSLDEGEYTASVVVKTITEAKPLTWSFLIVNPRSLSILNVQTDSNEREILYGWEGKSLAIECISCGGNPAPTLVWYKNSVSQTNILASNNSVVKDATGTYTVTLQHTMPLTKGDDRQQLICRSYYPDADAEYQASTNRSVLLLLFRKPNKPIASQATEVVSGGVLIVVCSTINSRPPASIHWLYNGSTYNGTLTSTIDPATDSFTTQSVFSSTVTASDNKRELRCVVTHQALTMPAELSTAINISVLYPPVVTVSATNTSIKANSSVLTCLADGIPNIGYQYGIWQQRWPGYGLVLERIGSKVLEITNLNYQHSGIYTCSVSNGVKETGTGREYMEGSVYLLVKSFPHIVNVNDTLCVVTKLQSRATANVKYYSNAGITEVNCFKSVNGSRQKENVCTTFHKDTTVNIHVFSHLVPTAGKETTVAIEIKTETDFGFYDVVVTNEIGSAVVELEVQLEADDEDLRAAMIGGVVGGLTVLIVAAVGGVLLFFKRQQLRSTVQRKMDNLDTDSPTSQYEELNSMTLSGSTYSSLKPGDKSSLKPASQSPSLDETTT